MLKSIRRLQISEMHGWLDFDVDLSGGINVFYGRNGSGKTTMLHVISNVLGGDMVRFLSLRFGTIEVDLSDNNKLTLRQIAPTDKGDREVECMINGHLIGKVNSRTLWRPSAVEQREQYTDMVRQLRTALGLQPKYFPAFRSTLEATAQLERLDPDDVLNYAVTRLGRRSPPNPYGERDSLPTMLLRRLFGDFMPKISYPSLYEVEEKIEEEVGAALLKVATANRQLFSKTLLNSLDAVTQSDRQAEVKPEQLLAEIDDLLKALDEPESESRATYDALAIRVNELKNRVVQEHTGETVSNILFVYRNALEERLKAQREAFDRLQQFLDSVNSFLEQKQLAIVRLPEEATRTKGDTRHEGRFVVALKNGTRAPLSILSSGERQLVCLIYSATRLAGEDTVVLVDEPELSLNIDWQRRLLAEMQGQMGAQQIIVCTHSPDIGGDHEAAVKILQPTLRTASGPIEVSPTGEGTFIDDDEVPF